MRLDDLLRRAWKNLLRNKLRSLITISSVAVGTASIITMASLVVGVQQVVEKEIIEGGDLLKITIPSVNNQDGLSEPLDKSHVEKLKKLEPVNSFLVKRTIDDRVFVEYNQFVTQPKLVAIDVEEAQELPLEFYKGNLMEGSDGIVVNETFLEQFSLKEDMDTGTEGDRYSVDILGEEVMVRITKPYYEQKGERSPKSIEFLMRIEGILKDNSYFEERLDSQGNKMPYIYLPLKTIEKLEENLNLVPGEEFAPMTIHMQVNSINSMDTVLEFLKDNNFHSFSNYETLKKVKYYFLIGKLILGGLGAIGLFVSIITTTNTMMMNINERTKEIGIMKSVGGRLSTIHALFIIETGYHGLCGGILGGILSHLFSGIINLIYKTCAPPFDLIIVEKLSIISLDLVFSGVGFAIIISLISGLLPANRAIKIDTLSVTKN